MFPTDIIIIAAGIAGLAAGCYAQMNGYRTQIFELHNQPRGLCTTWECKGYVSDSRFYYTVSPKNDYKCSWLTVST
ncbi:MAG: NAD(P)-binding protein [Fischerella sp.]|nr:NAD(P)-binding protein [Fischerella sp.]